MSPLQEVAALGNADLFNAWSSHPGRSRDEGSLDNPFVWGFLMKLLLGVVPLLVVLAAPVAGLAGHRFVLEARGEIGVDRYPAPGPAPVARMEAGERAAVLSCDDVFFCPNF